MLKSAAVLVLAAAAFAAASQDKPAEPKPASVPIAFEGSTITSLRVKNLKAAQEWYGKVLGTKVFYELEAAAWCELSGPVKNALIGLSQVGEGEKFESNGGSSLCFGVTDMAKSKEWLVKNKVELLGEVVEIPQTVKLLSFRDPDGNTLLFYEPWQGGK